MSKFLSVLLIIIGLSSCSTLFVTGDYYKYLDASEKALIKEFEKSELMEEGYVYAINGHQLLEELSHQDRSLVYVFNPSCSHDKYCYALKSVEQHAKDNNLSLYLIMSTYYNMHLAIQQDLNVNVLGLNASQYPGQGRNSRYVTAFKNEIKAEQYLKAHKEKYMGGFIYYIGQEIDTITHEPLIR